jgi:glycine cleavage system H protein
MVVRIAVLWSAPARAILRAVFYCIQGVCRMSEIKYTAEHEWLKVEGDNVVVIGITEFAQDALGDLVFVDLPEVGRKVAKGDDFAVVESVKTAAEVYTPVTGEIVAVNDNLSGDPELIKKSMDDGWIAKIRMENPAEIASLMDRNAYDAFLKDQAH